MTNGALVFVGHIAAQGTSDSVNQLPLWLQETQAIAAVATIIGVLIALYVAVVREPRKAGEERRRHKAQIDALRRASRGNVLRLKLERLFPPALERPFLVIRGGP